MSRWDETTRFPSGMSSGTCMSHSSPAVTIIIPAYVRTPHDLSLLGEALASVRAQSHRDYEVIVVDDGSPIPVRLSEDDSPALRVIRQRNTGSAMARNA